MLLSRPARLLSALGAAVMLVVGLSGSAAADPPGGAGPIIAGTQLALVNFNSGNCLVARGAASDAPVVATRCVRYADQVWRVGALSSYPGQYEIRNTNSNKCMLARSGGSTAYKVVQTTCSSQYSDQRWRFLDQPNSGFQTALIQNVNSNRCMVLQGAASGTQAIVTTCATRYDDQYWLGLNPNQLPHP